MEDFSSARSFEVKESAVQTAFLDEVNSRPKAVVGKAEDRLPGKDVADRIDSELKAFAAEHRANATPQMKEFQGLVADFANAADKKAAVEVIGPASQKLRVSLEKDASEKYDEIEAEAAKNPGRAALDAAYSENNRKLFDQASKLPSKEYERVLNLLQWKPDESAEDRQARVHEGLKNNPRLSKTFDDLEASIKAVNDSKSPREKELADQLSQDVEDISTIRDVIRKVAIRVDI